MQAAAPQADSPPTCHGCGSSMAALIDTISLLAAHVLRASAAVHATGAHTHSSGDCGTKGGRSCGEGESSAKCAQK